ncbi:MAG TPA: type II toxin-antitoxin system death-on-curing family toxin [Micropepsaceae bacterium]|nr:type II toxin-antitoxin system death-on-curing family toxin [Micropepsaceae bacterium]
MSDPVWVSRAALELLHDESLKEHGGAEGLRESGLLDSALARAQNLFAYEEVTDACRLAATYAFGIVKNHPFVDGNKRAAFIAAGLFLQMNGARLHADRAEAVLVMLDLASGELTELQFAEWLRKNTRPKDLGK